MNYLYILNVNRFYYASVYQLVILLLTIRFGFQVCLVFFKILYRPLCTLCVLCAEVATLVTFSVLVISSARLILHYSTHNLHEQIVLCSNSFCVSCKSVPACFRSQPAQRWVQFTTKVRHFRRLNHDRSEYWPSFSPRLWTFPDYMVEPQSFPANTAKT